jgi:hypothetical protein
MKRRSFLTLLGLAPVAAVIPVAAVSASAVDPMQDGFVVDLIADKIAVGSITRENICVGAVTASKITAGPITADRLAIGSIRANQISAVEFRAVLGLTPIPAAAHRQQA